MVTMQRVEGRLTSSSQEPLAGGTVTKRLLVDVDPNGQRLKLRAAASPATWPARVDTSSDSAPSDQLPPPAAKALQEREEVCHRLHVACGLCENSCNGRAVVPHPTPAAASFGWQTSRPRTTLCHAKMQPLVVY